LVRFTYNDIDTQGFRTAYIYCIILIRIGPWNAYKKIIFYIMYEPLAGSSLSNLLQLLAQNSFSISIPYIPRMLYAMTLSSIISPFRLKEHIKFDIKIRKTEIEHDPPLCNWSLEKWDHIFT